MLCLCCVFCNSQIFFGYHFTVINLMGGMRHYLLTSSCRQSIDVSMTAKARKRVRSAHGSPLSDTTSSPSCTPARKARPPSSTCGGHNLSKRTKQQNHITHIGQCPLPPQVTVPSAASDPKNTNVRPQIKISFTAGMPRV